MVSRPRILQTEDGVALAFNEKGHVCVVSCPLVGQCSFLTPLRDIAGMQDTAAEYVRLGAEWRALEARLRSICERLDNRSETEDA